MTAHNQPIAFLVTIRAYGTWLHGDERGSVDRDHNIHGLPMLPPDPGRADAMKRKMKAVPVEFDAAKRGAIERGILERCAERKWPVHAVNVRTNHVHVALTSNMSAKRTRSQVKAFATKALRDHGLADVDARIWSRGGSAKWLFTRIHIERACHYVATCQGPDLPKI